MRRISVRIQLVLVILATGFAGGLGTVAAQDGTATPAPSDAPEFSIYAVGDYANPWFDLTLEPDETVELTVGIENLGSEPVSLTAFATNAFNPPNGGFAAGTVEEEPIGPTRWLTFPSETFVLEPGDVEEQRFEVAVPAETAPGLYVIGLVAETSETLAIPGSENFRQLIRSAISVEITVPGEMTRGLEVGEPVVARAGPDWSLDVPVTNTGTARLRPQGELQVTTPDGEVVSTTDIEMGSVYGGNTSSVRVILPGQLPLGEYRVSLDLTDAETDASASIRDVAVALAEPETVEEAAFVVDPASVVPSGDPIQYADVAATITNNGQAITTANVTLDVQRDGETVESYPLAENRALPQGTTEFSQRYIPVDGWQPGTWTFELVISAVSGGTETVLATVDIADEIIVP